MSIRQLFSALWTTLFPYVPKCVGCGIEKGVAAYLCPSCAGELTGLEVGAANTAGLHSCSVYRYDGLAARIVRSYKYAGNRWLCAFMSEAMTQVLFRHQIRFDCVCHVPLHRKKRRKRGFDQAALLAQGIANLTGKPYIDALKRIRHTPSQTKLNAKQRKDNIAGAFVATEIA